MWTTLHLLAVVATASCLLASGVLKLRDREGAAAGVRGFSVIPESLIGPIATALPFVEIGLGLGLLLSRRSGFVVIALAALIVLLAFTAVVAISLARGERPSCHCFGELSAEPISRVTLGRNIALSAIAALALLGGTNFGGWFPTLVRSSAEAIVLIIVAVLAGAAIWWLSAQRGALQRRLVNVESERDQALARPTANVVPEIPSTVVWDKAGQTHTLVDLVAARHKAQLIVGVSPTCSICKDLVPQIPVWREQLGKEIDVKVLSWGTWEDSVAAYGAEADHLFVSPDGSAFSALAIEGTPGVVLLGVNDKVVAGPAHGGEEILALLAAIVQAIGVNMFTGMAHQVQQPQPLGGEEAGEEFLPGVGSLLVDAVVRDESGAETTLVDALEHLAPEGVPVVAWRDSCPFCAEIAPELVQFSERSEVVLVTNQDIATVRAQGLTGPVLQTVSADVSEALGVPGTPAGYPVRGGAVQPGGGVGGGGVLRMLTERSRALGTFVETPALRQRELMLAGAHADPDGRDVIPVESVPQTNE